MRTRKLIIAAIGIIVVCGVAVTVLQKRGVDELRLAAEQGDAYAQHTLGSLYAMGADVLGWDDAEAVRWFRLAAEQGYADAQFDLGQMYANGKGVPQDDAEAVRWYRLAAEQDASEQDKNAWFNNVDSALDDDDYSTYESEMHSLSIMLAQLTLGRMYANGEGVPQDYAEAVRWFRLAAEQGYPDAQYALGTMYADGHGVPKDSLLAYMWFSIASDGGKSVGELRDMERDMTRDEISRATELVQVCMESGYQSCRPQ